MARVKAGTKLGALTKLLDNLGQALPNMGDIDEQSLGGALGTGTHGTGLKLGAYHTLLTSLTLIDGLGERRVLSRDDGADLLDAMGVSLGTGGIVTEATIANVAPYRLRRKRYALPIDEIMANFNHLISVHRNLEFLYVPFSGHAVVLESDETDDETIVRPDEDDDKAAAELKLARDLFRYLPFIRRWLIMRAFKRHADQHFVEDWLRVYPSDRGTFRFNECEYHLPLEDGMRALAKFIEMMESRLSGVYLPIEVRVVAEDNYWLSPFYNRPTCSIAVHHDATRDFQPLLRASEEIFRSFAGRPHWGKQHSLAASDLRQLYPRFDDAVEIRRTLDPDRRFVSAYIERLLGL